MRIHVEEAGIRRFSLILPTGLALNRFTAGMVAKSLAEQGVQMNKKQARTFVKHLNRYRRSHKEWVLVEVESADGDKVKIKL